MKLRFGFSLVLIIFLLSSCTGRRTNTFPSNMVEMYVFSAALVEYSYTDKSGNFITKQAGAGEPIVFNQEEEFSLRLRGKTLPGVETRLIMEIAVDRERVAYIDTVGEGLDITLSED